MLDYRFEAAQPFRRGRNIISVRNSGTVEHSLTLVDLPDDVPPINEQLHSDVRRAVGTIARVPARAPGAGTRIAVDLMPGRYAMVCFVVDPDGVTHGLKGMSTEFRVQ